MSIAVYLNLVPSTMIDVDRSLPQGNQHYKFFVDGIFITKHIVFNFLERTKSKVFLSISVVRYFYYILIVDHSLPFSLKTKPKDSLHVPSTIHFVNQN